MINYEEELKKFHPSMDVNEAEDAIYVFTVTLPWRRLITVPAAGRM